MTHSNLVTRAGEWLHRQGCGVVLTEVQGLGSEEPDAIGFTAYGVSILIEVKVSRADFLADRNKPFRKNPAEGMGDYRLYLAPRGLIRPSDLPEGWGLIEATSQRLHRSSPNVPKRWNRHGAPFRRVNRQAERGLMYGLLRKATLKGLMPLVTESIRAEEARLRESPQ